MENIHKNEKNSKLMVQNSLSIKMKIFRYKVLLPIYFYHIALNVQRLTFPNKSDVPFSRSSNIGRMNVKFGPIFSTLRAPASTD